ncbi:restriction endonuclease subunit S [Herbivorax sp. ANBcel31]|uniref:restriction endonuclease subunit S n=1 Tax=Herbivorax sp. ANBcel31 TaxID=3069754 RepID=UPI0027B128E6|nr:restriction endonuclease subunit S [Herbivorax sp. ANBcel31]MDQ2087908.1 restriction endonuclease subunit S [Herbivorax sp. ANBcel31]
MIINKKVAIKDCCVFLKRSKIKAGEGVEQGIYPFYTSSSMLNKYLDYYEVEEESLVFGTGGNASVHHSYGKFSTSTDCFVLQNNRKHDINLKYMYLFLKSNIHILENGFKGAGLKHISKKYIENIIIPLPPLQTQKKIVEVLDKAQELLDARKEQIKLLDDLIQSVFYDMFGDPVTNSKGWEKIKLNDSCKVITGNTPSRKEIDNYGDFIEWIKSDNINTPYTYITSADEYLSQKGFEKARVVEKGSILMTCIAGSLNCIGNIAITDRRVAFNQQINAIIPQKYNLIFLYATLKLSKKYIQNSSSKSMKGMISKGKLQELKFVIPPIELQNQFAETVQKIESQKELIQQSLIELENNYNSLMQRAFKGELFND